MYIVYVIIIVDCLAHMHIHKMLTKDEWYNLHEITHFHSIRRFFIRSLVAGRKPNSGPIQATAQAGESKTNLSVFYARSHYR